MSLEKGRFKGTGIPSPKVERSSQEKLLSLKAMWWHRGMHVTERELLLRTKTTFLPVRVVQAASWGREVFVSWKVL